MKIFRMVKCRECGNYVDTKSKRDDGLPVMIGFGLDDGTIYNVCADCIIKKGREAHADT